MTKRLRIQRSTNASLESTCLTCSVHLASWQKRQIVWVLHGYVLDVPWILEHPCDSWLWDVPKLQNSCGTPSHGLGPYGFLHFWLTQHRKRTLFLVGNIDSRDSNRIARNLCWNRRSCCVSGHNMSIQKTHHHAQSFVLHATTPALPVCLSRLPWFSP